MNKSGPMVRGLWSSSSVLPFALCALPLAFLWFVLIDHLRMEWTVNPQYTYGWAVPFLCLYLLYERLARSGKRTAHSAPENQSSITDNSKFSRVSWFKKQLLAAEGRAGLIS